MNRKPSPWARYFPFESGVDFDVEGPFGYDGTGRVVKRTDDVLSFKLRMPAKRILAKKIPELDVTLSVSASKEGAGNRAEGKLVRGAAAERFTDDDVTMESNEAKRSRELTSSIEVAGEPLEIAVTWQDDERVKLRINGYKFTLTRS
jgi:hypothetical protein